MKNSLQVIVSISIAIIALSLGYYYGYALPKNNREILELQKLEFEEEQKNEVENRARLDVQAENEVLQQYKSECQKKYDANVESRVDLINKICMNGGGDMACVKKVTKDFWPYTTDETQAEKNNTYIERCVEMLEK